jgi:hypothetical protein
MYDVQYCTGMCSMYEHNHICHIQYSTYDDFPRVITESKVITQCMNNENYTTGGHQNKVSFFHYFRRECCICNFSLNGQCNAILPSGFFIPQVPKYPIRVFSNFCRNSPRYSHLKVYHRWQMEKNLQSEKF